MTRTLTSWTTAVGVALLLGVTPGITGVAGAATPRLELEAYSGERDDSYVYAGVAGISDQETLSAAVLVGSTWKQAPITNGSYEGWWEVSVGELVPAPGRYSVKVSLLDGVTVLESATTEITVTKYAGQLLDLSIEDHTLASKKLYAQVRGDGLGQKIALQRRVKKNGKKTWVTVRTATMPLLNGRSTEASVKLLLPRTTGYTTWRAVGRAGTWVSGTDTTYSTEVHRTDDRRHGAYLKRARSYLKRYCPRSTISIDTRDVTEGAAIGTAHAQYGGNSRSGSLTTRIALRSGLSKGELRHTAVHECAHIVQYRKIVKKGGAGYESYSKAIGKIYKVPGFVAVEQQADCMATAIVKSTRYNYYTKNCSGKRGKSARALWKALGKKYQANHIEW